MADDQPAQLHECSRCARPALLRIVGRCADCIAELYFRHPEEYATFRRDVEAEYGARKSA